MTGHGAKVRALGAFVLIGRLVLQSTAGLAAQTPDRVDYLTFAQGAIPVSIGGAGASRGAAFEHAVRIVDGNSVGFTIVSRADNTTDTEFIYELPAATTFDRFAVPQVLETPSPSQTFTRHVEVYGSSEGPTGEWVRLAHATLTTHERRGDTTVLELDNVVPVRWVRLRLVGGIEMLRDAMFLEFSEIIGNGTQEPAPLSKAFDGSWRARGVELELRQTGAVVTGCYDRAGDLEGTVSGRTLRATGVARSSGVPSVFLLNVADDGTMRGLVSTNGAPFRIYSASPADPDAGQGCPDIAEPVLGCGSVLHGINFDYDSDVLRADSESLLAALFEGLRGESSSAIVIEGHTSSEGEESYNQELAERRARAVVQDLVLRGIEASRLTATGIGESRPIASNDDETGRSLNRRVEIACS